VLDRRHPFTLAVVHEAHVAVGHQGRDYTRAEVQRRYYIPRAAAFVSGICYKCPFCRARKPTPIRPLQANLHKSRLQALKPAWYEVGMDHFGPFFLKANVKRWGLIFIDLTSRAVHIELVNSPNTEQVILAFERFCNRRARPKILRSDQGTGFVKFAKQLQLSEDEYRKTLAANLLHKFRVDVHFNPPYAPHWGGSWERMIQEVKKILQCCMEHRKSFQDPELQTFLTRAEAILNNRPMAFQADGKMLTPNNLVNPAADRMVPMIGENTVASVSRIRDATLDFWSRWQKFYLTSISAKQRFGQVEVHDLQEGDWVLVKEGNNPLVDQWTKGKIIETYESEDDKMIRAVTVEVDGVDLYRDINKIAILQGPALTRKKLRVSPVTTQLPGGHVAPDRNNDDDDAFVNAFRTRMCTDLCTCISGNTEISVSVATGPPLSPLQTLSLCSQPGIFSSQLGALTSSL